MFFQSEARRATASAEARRAKEGSGSDTHHVVDDRDGFREALKPTYDLLPGGQFDLPDGQISDPPVILPVQPHLQKYFCFSEMKIKLYDSPSRPTEGRHAIVTAAGRDAVDADGAADEST